ncbi:hypothetical protein HPB50_022894 [Hyalomma asiaticum]|uniref:Uncharacterized protein n=1 Tax=Hyalomma asiaticum TaxID=266040 RepID=A0ACB7SJQ7_HYAAI|nr:hypothetical protein HPB50_022894 [Hyalomma asiaticum]
MGHFAASTKHEGLRYYFEEASRLDYGQAKQILGAEHAARAVYRDAWKEADSLYKVRRKADPSHPWSVMKKEHFVAVMCYTLEKRNVCRHFNQLCRAAMPTKESWNSFPYKSLLYFLIGAFERLPDFHAPVVFRGVDKFVCNDNEARFGQFVSASVCPQQASKFGRGVFHLSLQGIPSGLVRDISAYSIYPLHKEVLIWPFCVFTLTVSMNENVKILKFDALATACDSVIWKERGMSFTLPESRTHLASAPSKRSATAKIKRAERPSISKEQDVPPSAKRAKSTSRKAAPERGHHVTPARSTVGRGASVTTSTVSATSKPVTTRESQRNVIERIKRDFVITVPRDSSNEPSSRVDLKGTRVRNPSVDGVGVRSSVGGQVLANAQPNWLAPSQRATCDTVITIPRESSREPSVRVLSGGPTRNAYALPAPVWNMPGRTHTHVEQKRGVAERAAHVSTSSNGPSDGWAPWKRVAAVVLIGLVVLSGIVLLFKLLSVF